MDKRGKVLTLLNGFYQIVNSFAVGPSKKETERRTINFSPDPKVINDSKILHVAMRDLCFPIANPDFDETILNKKITSDLLVDGFNQFQLTKFETSFFGCYKPFFYNSNVAKEVYEVLNGGQWQTPEGFWCQFDYQIKLLSALARIVLERFEDLLIEHFYLGDEPAKKLVNFKNPNLEFSRKIEFPPHLKQAGLYVLNSFSEILDVKFPNQEYSISIEQKGLEVIMTITATNGEILEVVKRTLTDYLSVIHGKKDPKDLFSDPHEIAKLEHRIELLMLDIKYQNHFLDHQKSQIIDHKKLLRDRDKEIKEQRVQIVKLISLAHKKEDYSAISHKTLQEILKVNDTTVLMLLASLQDSLNRKDEEAVKSSLGKIKEANPRLLNQLFETSRGVLIGVLGNEATDLLHKLI